MSEATEKGGVYERWGLYHAVTVGELREALAALPDDMVVVPNDVKNLALYAGGHDYAGFIDLGSAAEVSTIRAEEARGEE